MQVSAVGFLFQNRVKNDGFKGTNYTCIIHKLNKDGSFMRSSISSPVIKSSTTNTVSPKTAKSDITTMLKSITAKKDKSSKFVGATVKDGVKETEIHSIISDLLYAVRTKDAKGKNHFRILNRNNTQNLLTKNLYLNA